MNRKQTLKFHIDVKQIAITYKQFLLYVVLNFCQFSKLLFFL